MIETTIETLRRVWRRHGRLFVVFYLWSALLAGPSGPPMSDSVLLATIRLVDHHTFTLTDDVAPAVAQQTLAFDLSTHDGRIFSGVPPGASVLAVPYYLIVSPIFSVFDERTIAGKRLANYYLRNSDELGLPPPAHFKDLYLLQISLVWLLMAPLFAAFACRLHSLLRQRGVADLPAMVVVLASSLGSMTLYYSSIYSRQGLAYLLIWHGVLTLAEARPLTRRRALIAGVLLGVPISIDYASVILVGIGLICFLPAMTTQRRLQLLAPIVVVAGLVATYHQLAFGSPLSTPYDHRFWVTPEPLASQGIDMSSFEKGEYAGMNPPSLGVMARLSFGPFKGLFVYSPILLLGLVGHFIGLRLPRARRKLGACLAAYFAYLIFNSTMGTHLAAPFDRVIWGGLNVLWGPRHLLGVLPFVAVGLVCLDWGRLGVRLAGIAAGVVSLVLNISATMFSDVVMSRPALGPELQVPPRYVAGLVFSRGPRLPLLDSYGCSSWFQAVVWIGLVAATAWVVRTEGSRPPNNLREVREASRCVWRG